MNQINIAFICDNNYALPARTAINSIIKNKDTNSFVKIYIIGVELSAENIAHFQKISGKDVAVQLIEKANIYQDVGLNHIYVSKAALFKFTLAKIIAEDKVLYLDDDVIVEQSLTDFYNTDISQHYAAVINDFLAEKYGDNKRLNHKNYFNSGVMLLNLRKLREDNIPTKLLEYKKKNNSKYMDQDAFNVVFAENVKFMPVQFNYLNAYDEANDSVLKENISNIVVRHYASYAHLKPWNNINATNAGLWLQYVLPEDLGDVLKNYFQNINIGSINENINKINENIKQLQYQNKRLDEKIKKMQKSKISARCKRLLKKLFYKNKNNKKKFRLFGIPLFSLKKQPGKKVFKILGLKFSFKEKVDKWGGVNQELSECITPVHDLVNDYQPAFNKCGYVVERKNNKIIISGNNLIIEGEADNTLWTAASVLCNDEYHFDCAQKYTMFDIGLNLGITSLHKARDKNCVQIYGYEPFTPTFKLAEKNMKLNPELAQKISIFNYGLGDCDKEIAINYNPERPGAMSSVKNIFSECSDVEKIKIKSASKILAPLIKTSKGKIFLKIDCEGAEKEILPDLHKSGLLKKVDIIVMEWHFENPQWIIDLLTENNFVVFRLNVVPDEIGMIRAYRKDSI
ncbi:MAG: FkbM family methyltransferase [Alphaproteobacteria bacterium]|nr:FkbM family methyltransferase [Alphaproteobacteria bacterium]